MLYATTEKVFRQDLSQQKNRYVSGFCHIHGKTPREILPVNSYEKSSSFIVIFLSVCCKMIPFFDKFYLLYHVYICYTRFEMNAMQNRILCVKCSANGELSLKRKVRLTV